MASSSVRFTNGAFVSVEGAEGMAVRARALPGVIQRKVADALGVGADELVAMLRGVAPVGAQDDDQPGRLREAVHREAGPSEIAIDVVVDPRDSKGQGYAPHVEYGHVAENGTHVPAQPFFWPTIRVQRRRIRSRVARAASAGIREATAGGDA